MGSLCMAVAKKDMEMKQINAATEIWTDKLNLYVIFLSHYII